MGRGVAPEKEWFSGGAVPVLTVLSPQKKAGGSRFFRTRAAGFCLKGGKEVRCQDDQADQGGGSQQPSLPDRGLLPAGKGQVECPAQQQESKGEEIPPVFEHQSGEPSAAQAKTGQDQRDFSAEGKGRGGENRPAFHKQAVYLRDFPHYRLPRCG